MRDSRTGLPVFVGLAAGVALYYYTDWLPLVVLGGLVFLALAWIRLDLALVFILFSAPFYRFPKTFGSAEFTLTESLVLACFVAWASRRLYQRFTAGDWGLDLPSGWRPWTSPAGFFLAVATVSLLFSQYLHVSLREYRVEIIEPLLFYLMLLSALRGERAVWRMANAFVLLGVGVSIFALYHYFFIGIVENTGGVQRMLGIYHSPNALGLFLGRVAPVALALGLRRRDAKYTRSPLSVRIRMWMDGRGPGWPHLVAVPLIGASLLLSFSRGAWLGAMVGFALIAAFRGRRALLALAGGAAVALLAAIPFHGLGRLVSDVTTEQRLYVWQAALRIIADHPLTGVGLDNFLYYYRERGYMLPEAWAEPDVSHPHNLLLDFWTRLGVLGLASLVWLQLSFWRRGLRLHAALKGRSLQFVALALMASMADYLVHGMLDNSYFLIDMAIVFWFTYGLMEVMGKEVAPEGAP
ncbi:MAG: O-antigen ligase family protein [Dehalococcoidia bacterium]|nr:O-antigen ligase family protein [Dehalococcoidia bacterium]